MTEMAGISSIRPPGVHGPAGCVGFPIPYSTCRIVALDESGGPTGRDLPPGERGMILFRSPNVFPGFLNDRDTAKAFTDDGWLATGDVGWLDEEGRIHLSGRSKDLIIRSGHNIDPKVIEDALGSHPSVQLCAAVGAPDAYAGELPVAFAVLKPGATEPTEAELSDWTSARVDEPPARPKSVSIIAAMPMTNVGKIFKPNCVAWRLKTPCAMPCRDWTPSLVGTLQLTPFSAPAEASPRPLPCLRVRNLRNAMRLKQL